MTPAMGREGFHGQQGCQPTHARARDGYGTRNLAKYPNLPPTLRSNPNPALCAPPLESPERHHVEIGEELTHDEMPTTLENPLELTKSGVLIRYLAEDQRQVGGVEVPVRIREGTSVCPGRDHVLDAAFSSTAHHVIEHLLLEVQDVECAASIQPPGHGQGIVASTWSYLQQLVFGSGSEYLAQPSPRDERTGQLDQEAQPVRARRRVPAPPKYTG